MFIKKSNNISVAPQSLCCSLPPELRHPITKQHLALNRQACSEKTDSGVNQEECAQINQPIRYTTHVKMSSHKVQKLLYNVPAFTMQA